ncbi:MAG: pyruvate oxidase, partial [Candidatus Nitrosopolaris sp.]
LLMVGTSFPYLEYLPRPGQARGIQIDIKAEKIGLRYPVEIGLVGDSKLILSSLLPLLDQRYELEFLQSKQDAMKKWNRLMREQSTRNDKPIKPQVIAQAVSDELEDNAIISVDCGTNTSWAARYCNSGRGG